MNFYKKTGLLIITLLCAISHAFGQDCTLTVAIMASNNGVICSGNAVILTATPSAGTAPYTYVWSTGETTASISVNKGATYSVSVTDKTDGCQPVVQTITVTESTTPSTPTASDVIVCANTPATLQATAPGGTYSWYDAPVGGNLVYTGDTFTTPPIKQNTTYYVETSFGGCPSARNAVNITLTGNPTGGGDPVCAGNQATLKAAGGDNYAWYDAPNGNLVGSGPTFVTPPITTNTTYYLRSTVNGCSSGSIPVTAVVTPYPTAPIAANVPVCPGSPANLHADSYGIISWYDVPTGGTPLIVSPDYTTPALTATTTYYVDNTANGCVSQRTPVVVTVNPTPDAPAVQPVTVCSGTSATLTASSVAGGTYNWYADPGALTLVGTGSPFQTPALTATTTYYAQTVSNGCVSSLTPVQVTVTPNPDAPTATVSQVCQNTPSVLKATAPGGNYEWYDAATGGNLLATGDTYTVPSLAANTTYYVQTTINGCVSARTAVNATIFPPATPPTATGTTICSGSSAVLTASGSGNYQWYDSATGGTELTAGKTFVTPALTADATYYVQGFVNDCASTRTAVTVTVTTAPAKPTVSDVTVCPASATTLTASVPAGGTVSWYDAPKNGTLLATGNTFTTPKIYSSTVYYVENAVNGCSSARVAVNVGTVPVIYPQFSYATQTYCTTGPNAVPVINDPDGGTFSATPVGLVFVSTTTGEINVHTSLPGNYIITFQGNETCHTISQVGITIVLTPNATFSYATPLCQFGEGGSPIFTGTASAGTFSATPAGLVFLDYAPGTIDLKKSLPGTYTVTNTIPALGTCAEAKATSTVTIGAGVTVDAGPDQTIQAGTTAQLAGVITGVATGKWTGGTGTFSDPTNSNAVYTPGPGEVTAKLTLTSGPPGGGCAAKSDEVTITIVPTPTAPTAADAAICIGNSVILKATAPGGTYTWYDAATGGNLLFTGPNFQTPALTSNTVYYVQTTISGSTSSRTSVQVTTNTVPALPTAASVPTCYNTSTTLKATGSTGSYQWYDAATGGTLLASTDTYTTPVLTANASYYVQALNNSCASARVEVDVTITSGPAITSAAADAVCSGTPLNYTITSDTPGATYSWARPQVTGISNAAVASHQSNQITETLVNITNSPIDVTYNITAGTTGCSSNFQYVVTVNPTPTLASSSTVSACNNTTLNYTITLSDPSASFTWSRPAVDGISNAAVTGQEAATIKEVLNNTTSLPVNVVYSVTYVKGTCSGTLTFTATINPTVVITSNANGTICSNNALNYQITSNIAAVTYNWRRPAVPNISNPAVSDQTSSTINETLVNTGPDPVNVTYYMVATAYGCPSLTATLVVTVYPTPPVASSVLSNSPVCTGSSIRLTTPVYDGATYAWTGPDGWTSTDQNPVINNVTLANTGTYSLSIVINGCPGPPKSIDVQVNTPATAIAGPDQTICINTTVVQLSGTINGGTKTGIWTTSGTGVFTPKNDDLNAQYTPSDQDKLNGSVLLTLTSTSKDDCTISSSSTKITFAPTPAVYAGPDQEACSQTNAVPLAGVLLKPGTATWSTAGTGTFNPSATLLNAVYVPSAADVSAGSVTLTLHYINPSGSGLCDIPTDDMTINFAPPPTVSAGPMKYVLQGRRVTLTPSVSDENVTYLWSPNVNISDPTLKNPVVTGGTADQVYTLTITDSRGCKSSSNVIVRVTPEITINNTFTPNGDGKNDVWDIVGLIAYDQAFVDIFDRYGAKVYESIGYNKPWDGTFNGKPVPVGTYYYIIKLNLNNQVLSGHVTVIR